jgi:hypothetical protein
MGGGGTGGDVSFWRVGVQKQIRRLEQGKLEDIPDIGKDLSEMIDEYITTRT